jgi:hypothetical protein
MSNHVFLRDLARKGSRSQHTPRNRKKRPKTFGSEDAAKLWAERHGIKNYQLVNLRNEESKQKKLQIVVSE